MTIRNYTFFSPNGTEFPVTANSDAKLYMLLAGNDYSQFIIKHWSEPTLTGLNKIYADTSVLLGGRYFELNNEPVGLKPNSINYIHANVDPSNVQNPVTLSVETANNSNSKDINSGSGVLKHLIDIVTTSSVAITSSTKVLSTRTVDNLTVKGSLEVSTISTQFIWAYGLTGTLRRTGNVVEWIVNRSVVNGSNAHEQTADAVMPLGFRPIERTYVDVALTNSGGFMPWAIARIDSNGNTYITNNSHSGARTAQAFGTWITNDPFPTN